MTLEEAKKKIEELGDDAWKKWKKEGNLISQGYALGMDDALGIVDKLDHEPVGNPDTLTLRELAQELRRLFRFKYLTVDPYADEITFWMDKPEWVCDSWWAGDSSYLFDFYANRLNAYLDLSEYKDADGNIDYSKCLVEVE